LDNIAAPTIKTNTGDLYNLKVADHTASITLSLFDELGEAAKPGDILQLMNG
jgi:hypothetical protein